MHQRILQLYYNFLTGQMHMGLLNGIYFWKSKYWMIWEAVSARRNKWPLGERLQHHISVRRTLWEIYKVWKQLHVHKILKLGAKMYRRILQVYYNFSLDKSAQACWMDYIYIYIYRKLLNWPRRLFKPPQKRVVWSHDLSNFVKEEQGMSFVLKVISLANLDDKSETSRHRTCWLWYF